jgi:hypothetical protein
MRAYATTQSATVSGTQSFTVTGLDAQEFYEGPLSPVRLTKLDYCMPIGPSARDRYSKVMETVSYLIALNHAAKTLPSPNVISVLVS